MSLSPDTIQLLTSLAPFLMPAVLLLASAVVSRLITLAQTHLGMQFTATQVQALHDAATTAAGNAMAMITRGAIAPTDVHAGSVAIIRLAAQARAAVPDAADSIGVTVPDLAHIIVGKVGALMSADNTIPTVPAPAPVAVTPSTQETSVHA